MHPLLRYTLDLFEPLAPIESAQKLPTATAKQRPPEPPRLVAALGPMLPAQTLSQAIAPAAFAHPQANRKVSLDKAVVAYLFTRAKRRTIGFVIGPDGLVVRAPKWTPMFEVEAALQEKALWILRKLAETQERHTRREEARIEWRDGVSLPYLGGTLTVALDPSHGFAGVGALLDAGVLRVGLPKTATPQQIRDAVQAWLMRQAQATFKQRLDHFAPLLQVQWRKLSLSNAGTRWGSARTDGSIRLNWRLIHFRPPVIDYVVAHELSHLRVMDHSAQFWDTVRTVVPDYASLRGQLKDDAIPKW
jgi:predicted metal-dependent hydrolase